MKLDPAIQDDLTMVAASRLPDVPGTREPMAAAPSLTSSIRRRDCPVCGEASGKSTAFLCSSLDESRLTNLSFASRKTPEFMSYELVRCSRCATVFASEAPTASALARAYHESDYNSSVEAALAASVYRKALEPYLGKISNRGVALEIGTGTGIFLRHLRELGFREPVGIEPSDAAIDAAPMDVKHQIRRGVFTGDEFPPASLSFIGCFQTLEHIPEPRAFVESAFELLEPGGMIALITHDYTALINRILKARSPIIDIEHLQLFCPESLRYLVASAGYDVHAMKPIRNIYPISYWLNLLPLPRALKNATLAAARGVRIAQTSIGMNVGNLLTVAQKPQAPMP
jgi:SAM-dependent methyltransferase